MALANLDDLKSAVTKWMARGDVAGSAEEFIALAEAGLNRELAPVETDVALTGTIDSRSIDISGTACVEALALFLERTGRTEKPLKRKADGTFPYRDELGEPSIWTVDGDNIDFDCKLDQAYSFRFRTRQRFALSDSQPTNWLLTNHPDVYLAATLLWGGVFTRNSPFAATHVSVLDRALPSVRHAIAQRNRGVSGMDPMVATAGRRQCFNGQVG